MIAHRTADNPAERYQTVGQLQKELSSPKRPYLILLLPIILMVLVAVVFYPSSRPVQPAEAPKVVDTIVRVIRESFHNQTLQIANRLIKKYPNIPESTIRQDCESRFQHLVASVFN